MKDVRTPNKLQREYTVEEAQAMQRWLKNEQAMMRRRDRANAWKAFFSALRTIYRGHK